ncbi:MAG: hypothetical protein IPG04_08310 [Polyangiaceae bacterium]|nr:hypothetical protein [Polyangiaceae bacterium]
MSVDLEGEIDGILGSQVGGPSSNTKSWMEIVRLRRVQSRDSVEEDAMECSVIGAGAGIDETDGDALLLGRSRSG